MPTKDCWFSLLNRVVIFEFMVPVTLKISYLPEKENKQVPLKFLKVRGNKRLVRLLWIALSFNTQKGSSHGSCSWEFTPKV